MSGDEGGNCSKSDRKACTDSETHSPSFDPPGPNRGSADDKRKLVKRLKRLRAEWMAGGVFQDYTVSWEIGEMRAFLSVEEPGFFAWYVWPIRKHSIDSLHGSPS